MRAMLWSQSWVLLSDLDAGWWWPCHYHLALLFPGCMMGSHPSSNICIQASGEHWMQTREWHQVWNDLSSAITRRQHTLSPKAKRIFDQSLCRNGDVESLNVILHTLGKHSWAGYRCEAIEKVHQDAESGDTPRLKLCTQGIGQGYQVFMWPLWIVLVQARCLPTPAGTSPSKKMSVAKIWNDTVVLC